MNQFGNSAPGGNKLEEKRRNYLIVGTTWPALVCGVIARARGAQVFLLDPPTDFGWKSRIARWAQLHALLLEDYDKIQLHEESYAAPTRAALRIAERADLECESERGEAGWTTPPTRISLGRSIASMRELVSIADAWARITPGATIRASSRAMRMVLREMATPARIMAPLLNLSRSAAVGRALMVSLAERLLRGTDVDSPSSRAIADGRPGSVKAIVILNQGLTYGNMFSYQDLLPGNNSSAWSPRRVGFVSTKGGVLVNGRTAVPFPPPPSPSKILGSSTSIIVSLLRKPSCAKSIWARHVLDSRAASAGAYFRMQFPCAQAALLAFDVQVPVHVVLGLERVGIRTVSLQERPALSFDCAAPTITGEMLTASDLFNERVLTSPACAVRSARPIGMWRTDLLEDYRKITTTAEDASRPLILALPYHVDDNGKRAVDPVPTSTRSVGAFLEDIALIASAYPECDIVVRSKNSQWTVDGRLEEVRRALIACGNVILDSDYSTLNRSYQLASKASLIVAKPTSLVDEALAFGVPCIVHDFTHNHVGYGQALLPYLPHQLWASSRDEFLARVDWVLNNPEGFENWWEPHRKRIYGDWADGDVRKRLHRVLEEMLIQGP